jgi:hypothetical protein
MTNLTMAAEPNGVAVCHCNDCGTDFSMSAAAVPPDFKRAAKK